MTTNQPQSGFHAARWNEPLIDELGDGGERGLMPPTVDAEIADAVGDVAAALPDDMRRSEAPALPELPQHRVLRHYLRLSQMTMGFDVTPDMMGTCTMKYSPKVHEYHRPPRRRFSDAPPAAASSSTLQGIARDHVPLR